MEVEAKMKKAIEEAKEDEEEAMMVQVKIRRRIVHRQIVVPYDLPRIDLFLFV